MNEGINMSIALVSIRINVFQGIPTVPATIGNNTLRIQTKRVKKIVFFPCLITCFFAS